VNLLTERGGQPIFYMSVVKLMRLTKKIVTAYEFVTQNEPEEGPIERRDIDLINAEKVSCHGEHNYLQFGKPNVLIYTVLLLTARRFN